MQANTKAQNRQSSHHNAPSIAVPYQGPFLITNHQTSASVQTHKNSGEWKLQQIAKYCVYMKEKEEKLEEIAPLKRWEFFKRMSCFIGSRNFRQCKSQHDKFIKKKGNLTEITQSLCEANPSLKKLIEREEERYQMLNEKKEKEREMKLKKQSLKTADEYESEEPKFENKFEELKIGSELWMSSGEENKKEKKVEEIGKDFFLDWIKKYGCMGTKATQN